MTPFTSYAGYASAYVLMAIAGLWFVMLAGVWYDRENYSGILIMIIVLLGWFMLSAGFFAVVPINIAIIASGILTAIVFFVSVYFLDFEYDNMIPIPRLITMSNQDDFGMHSVSYPPQERKYEYTSTISDRSSKPRYWGSWKGQVICAIAEARTPLTLDQIITRTKLSPKAAATAILELLEFGSLRYENDETHTVEPRLYQEYRAYLERTQQPVVEYTEPSSISETTDGRKHRTNNGEMVRSKSEVIVANILTSLGLYYEYEKPLANPQDSNDVVHPDFTIHHGGKVFYWEHLGMLTKPEYKASWEWKINWYRKCGYDVITSRDGEDGSIDAQTIEAIALKRIFGNR